MPTSMISSSETLNKRTLWFFYSLTHTDKGIHIERRTHRYRHRDTYTNTHINTKVTNTKRHTNTSINIQTHTLKEKGK